MSGNHHLSCKTCGDEMPTGEWFPTDEQLCYFCVEQFADEQHLRLCIWCNCVLSEGRLVYNKQYCKDCETDCKKECKRCHRPFPNFKNFNLSDTVCDSCFKKSEKKKEKRRKKNEFQQ